MTRKTIDNQVKSQVDKCYEKLDTKLEVLDKNSNEFSIIKRYVKNTHGSSHDRDNHFKLQIIEVFKVERNDQNERYKKFQEMDNHMLLWYGSRATNFAGILSQGIRVVPPKVNNTSRMFGKGIYFTDMVSKSADYCRPIDGIRLLLLCKIAICNQ